MEYEDLEPLIECRSLWFVCDGKKVMLLRKFDLVLGDAKEFTAFVSEKISCKTEYC